MLAQDGTAEPVLLDQILRANEERGKFIFALQLRTSKIGNHTRLIHTLLKAVLTTHTRTTPRHRAARVLACYIME